MMIMMMTQMTMVMMMTMTMMKRLRLIYTWLLMIDDASRDAIFDDFAKHDGRTDGPTDRRTDGRTDTSAYWDAMDASKNERWSGKP